MHMAASIRTGSSGGSHSGKNGFVTYFANVKATMAIKLGRTITHSTHNLTKPMKGPKV